MKHPFQTSLYREKFVITDINNQSDDHDKTITAMSNRIVITLHDAQGHPYDSYVIRTKNMHSCTRFGAAILKEHHDNGPLGGRMHNRNWDRLWQDVIKGYERDWTEDIWCTIHHKGRLIFSDGEPHQFLTIIEQCDATQKQEYAQSVSLAEQIFNQAGKPVNIQYDMNVAFVTSITSDQAKSGIIVRSGSGTTTFNFTALPKGDQKHVHPHTILSVAASFLELIQMGFFVGLMNKKQEYDLIEKFSTDYKHHKRAQERLANLGRAIDSFDNMFDVKYRPERPLIKEIVQEAEKIAVTLLQDELQEKMDRGEIDEKDWVV